MAVVVREPRTGLVTHDRTWADWRRRWDRRPRSFPSRIRACPWCWAFGAMEMVDGHPAGVPCLACGRVGGP